MVAGFARQIIGRFVKGTIPGEVKKRMEKALPEIVKKMEAKGMALETVPLPVVIRDAIFRLIRSVVPSGDISDLIRDSIDDKVITLVASRPRVPGLAGAVKATLDATIEVIL